MVHITSGRSVQVVLCLVVIFFFSVYNVRSEDIQYCSFFSNRAPSPQPTLKNCTWFKSNCCCMQEEIAVTFSNVKPLPGANKKCQNYLNYLMCYICAPNQNLFYLRERLTVCKEFCNNFYEACRYAILKGSMIGNLYQNGSEFCLSRSFKVDDAVNGKCFNHDFPEETTEDAVSNIYPLLELLIGTLILQSLLVWESWSIG
ncbi:hedgehog-interacting protein [Argonauta hians]